MPTLPITPDMVLRAYTLGLFPMAYSRTSAETHWIEPKKRGVIEIESFHMSRRLKRTLAHTAWSFSTDTCFQEVIKACAAPRASEKDTWINQEISSLYTALHHMGYAHSIEVWGPQNTLVGGLYGLSLGKVFFGESMFSRERDASKLALIYLFCRLKMGQFLLIDTQFFTPHLAQFGAIEIPQEVYVHRLPTLFSEEGNYFALPSPLKGKDILAFLKEKHRQSEKNK